MSHHCKYIGKNKLFTFCNPLKSFYFLVKLFLKWQILFKTLGLFATDYSKLKNYKKAYKKSLLNFT